MKRILILSLIVVPLLISCNSSSNKTSETVEEQTGLTEHINVEVFEEKMNLADVQIIDVRTPEEWSEGVIEGAERLNIMDESFRQNLSKLNKEVPVLVYCRSGGRSTKAMGIMSSEGFVEVYNLVGGITAWNKAGKSIVD